MCARYRPATHLMINYIRRHLWDDLFPGQNIPRWLALRVMRIPPELLLKHPVEVLLYEALHSISPCDLPALNAYNSFRVDLVAELVDPPSSTEPVEFKVVYYPEKEPSYWLATHVFGFTDSELINVGGVPPASIGEPSREILRFLLVIYKVCQKEIKLDHPIVKPWHRQRYLLLRYYLDAVYHIVN